MDSIRYLGVTITHDLRWNTHISNMCTKANRFLRQNLYQCPQDVKEAAYRGLVRPILEYGSCVWYILDVPWVEYKMDRAAHGDRQGHQVRMGDP